MIDYGGSDLNQIAWYNFKDNSKILIILDKSENHVPLIVNRTCSVNIAECPPEQSNDDSVYDYIVLLDVIGKHSLPVKYIKETLKNLAPNGTLLLIVNNKYGLKYFCGAPDQYTGVPFDNFYVDTIAQCGKTYDKTTLISFVTEAGFSSYKFYYPMPDYKFAQVIYTDNILPGEDMLEKVIFFFDNEQGLVFDQRNLYTDIVKNDVFPFFSNSYIIECTNGQELCDIDYSAITSDRPCENSFITSIHHNKTVTKELMYHEEYQSIHKFRENMSMLFERGINVIDAEYTNSVIKMDYIKYPTLANHIRKLFKEKKADEIKTIFVQLWDIILKSSAEVDESYNAFKEKYVDIEWGPILKDAFIELIPLNCFYSDNDDFIFFDQEFRLENLPAKYIIYRALRYTYKCIPGMTYVITLKSLRDTFGISDKMWEAFQQEEKLFLSKIKQHDKHSAFYKHVVFNETEKYQKILSDNQISIDTFLEKSVGKKIIIFGTGKVAEQFMFKFGNKYPLAMVIDNNPEKEGTAFYGLMIKNAIEIIDVPRDERYVIICTNERNYPKIRRQLENLGVYEYIWFNPDFI